MMKSFQKDSTCTKADRHRSAFDPICLGIFGGQTPFFMGEIWVKSRCPTCFPPFFLGETHHFLSMVQEFGKMVMWHLGHRNAITTGGGVHVGPVDLWRRGQGLRWHRGLSIPNIDEKNGKVGFM
jgi:hypothetical protein